MFANSQVLRYFENLEKLRKNDYRSVYENFGIKPKSNGLTTNVVDRKLSFLPDNSNPDKVSIVLDPEKFISFKKPFIMDMEDLKPTVKDPNEPGSGLIQTVDTYSLNPEDNTSRTIEKLFAGKPTEHTVTVHIANNGHIPYHSHVVGKDIRLTKGEEPSYEKTVKVFPQGGSVSITGYERPGNKGEVIGVQHITLSGIHPDTPYSRIMDNESVGHSNRYNNFPVEADDRFLLEQAFQASQPKETVPFIDGHIIQVEKFKPGKPREQQHFEKIYTKTYEINSDTGFVTHTHINHGTGEKKVTIYPSSASSSE